MSAALDLTGLQALRVRLAAAARPSLARMAPLMEGWEDIIAEDNRVGVLEGRDKDDQPAPDLRYRGGEGRRTAFRGGLARGKVEHQLQGFGPLAAGLHGNLSPAEYRKLTGPRLAPRGTGSRVITNLVTEHGQVGDTFAAVGYWQDVVTATGVDLLSPHFHGPTKTGKGHLATLPRYDLAGVRKRGRDRARLLAVAFVKTLLVP